MAGVDGTVAAWLCGKCGHTHPRAYDCEAVKATLETQLIDAGGPTLPAKAKHSWVGAPAIFALQMEGMILMKAFGEMPYLVGSALERKDHRDVDVRMVFDDDKYAAFFGEAKSEQGIFYALLCTAVSEYLQKRTGLPIDFQIQRRSDVKPSDWDKRRQPLAMFLDGAINGPKPPPWRAELDDD